MSAKHTPGPWSVDEYVSGAGWSDPRPACAVMCRDNNKVVCEIPDYTVGEFDKADARLIAAAPELLEALNRLTSFVVTEVVESCNGNKCRELWCEGCFGEETAERTVNEARDALTNARAAIAKATGAES